MITALWKHAYVLFTVTLPDLMLYVGRHPQRSDLILKCLSTVMYVYGATLKINDVSSITPRQLTHIAIYLQNAYFLLNSLTHEFANNIFHNIIST